MDKSTKILIYAVLGVVVFHALFNLFFSHSRLKDAVNEIKSVKSDLKIVSDSLTASRKKLNMVMENLDNNQAKINLMKSEVETLYLDYQKDDAKSRVEIITLTNDLKKEEENIDSLKRELDKLEK